MTIKELKTYLENFKDTDLVAVSMWDNSGSTYYVPHAPCCRPVTFKPVKQDGKRVAVIGFFDDCMGHTVERKGE